MPLRAVLWIRIRLKLKGRIRNRIRTNVKQDPDPLQSDKLDLDPHQFADDKPNCMENEPI
jgi:hypothetical protein